MRTNRRDVLPKVWLGVGLAVAISVGVTLALALTQQALTFEAQEAFGGSLSIIAVGFVTWMIFWMRRTARTISAELRGKLEDAIKMGSTAVVVMAALAVGREGLETALFFFTAAQAAGETTQPLDRLPARHRRRVVLAYLLYRGAVKINLGRFFTITGALLIFVAAGILAYGVHDLQEAGILPGLNTLAFDVSARDPARLLVRRPAQGRLQLLPADHRAGGRRLGRSTSPSCSRCSCAPAQPRRPRPRQHPQ